MSEVPKTFEYRKAPNVDASGILSVMKEVAPEIPMSLDTPELEQQMQFEIKSCCH
jgi:hypothetical protein